jgi:hypothetical protein
VIDTASNHTPSQSPNTTNVADAALVHVPLCAADARRSAHNIVRWNSYLPTDCVRMMVNMGWDYTT